MMASGDSALKQLIECSICLEEYKDPYALTCLHTYCYDCLRPMVKGDGTLACPECRYKSTIYMAKRDFKTQTLVEMYHIQKKAEVQVNGHFPVVCSVCLQANKAIVSRCVQCEEYLCENCQTAHKGMKISRDHSLVTVDDIVKTLLAASDQIRSNLKSDIDQMSSKKSEICKTIEDLATSKDKQLTELSQYCSDIIKSIEQHCNNMKTHMQKQSYKVINELSKGKKQLQNHINDLQEKLDFQSKMLGQENLPLLDEKVKAGGLYESNIEKATAEAQELLMKYNDSSVKLVITKSSVWSPANVRVQTCGLQDRDGLVKEDKEYKFKVSDDIKVLEEIAHRLIKEAKEEDSDSDSGIDYDNRSSDGDKGDQDELIGACGSSEIISINATDEKWMISQAFSNILRGSYEKAAYLKQQPNVEILAMCAVKDSLWCAVKTGQNQFYIYGYDQKCEVRMQIRDVAIQRIKSMAYEAKSGHVIIACCGEFGLHLVSARGKYIMKIRDGSYFSVSIHDNKIYALANSTKPLGEKGIIVLKRVGTGTWTKSAHLISTELFYHNDRIFAHQQGFHVSRNMQCLDKATVITHHKLTSNTLDCVERTISKNQLNSRMGNNSHNYYILCQTDEYGNLLVFEKHNQKLSICDSAENFHSCSLIQQLVGKNGVRVADVAINSSNSDVWVVTENSDIIRYSLRESSTAEAVSAQC